MQIIKTKFTGLIFYKRETFRDERGYFRELFIEKDLKKKFVFDYYSLSKKNVLRGIHLQLKKPQGKLLTVLKKPYENQNRIIDFQSPAPSSDKAYQTFCGT